MRGTERRGNSNRQAKQKQRERIAQDHPQNISALSTKGHANTDFIGAPRDALRNDAIQSDAGQQQREATEKTYQPRRQFLLLESPVNLIVQTLHAENRQL